MSFIISVYPWTSRGLSWLVCTITDWVCSVDIRIYSELCRFRWDARNNEQLCPHRLSAKSAKKKFYVRLIQILISGSRATIHIFADNLGAKKQAENPLFYSERGISAYSTTSWGKLYIRRDSTRLQVFRRNSSGYSHKWTLTSKTVEMPISILSKVYYQRSVPKY